MKPAWSTSSPAGTIFLLYLLLTGCSHSHGFIEETLETTDLAGNPLFDPSGSTQSGEKSESNAGNVLSSSFATERLSPTDSASSTSAPGDARECASRAVWGILDVRGFPIGEEIASNGAEYHPVFLLDLDFNIMLWREQRLYLFADSSFWAQKAAPGITNASQGSFDFSKREFDFDLGVAWNYTGPWEGRLFAYSFNNLNRGNSATSPSGFNDGVGLESRYYLGEAYADLGTAAFDQARATFLSVGYYPTKTMVDANGNQFKPGPFARAYLTCDLWGERYYLFGDVQFIAARSFQPTLFTWDAGLAGRPFASLPRLEIRVGTEDILNLRGGDMETTVYLGVRYIY